MGATAALFSATTAFAAGIPPNNGTVNSPPAGRILGSFPVRDFVHTAGWVPDDRVTVNVIRNGVAIGTATAAAPVFDKIANEWVVDVNHPGGSCWEGNTPDIQQGDAIRTTIVDNATDPTRIGIADEIVTQNVTAAAIAETAPGSHHLIVHGTAETQTGTQFAAGELESRLVANKQIFAIDGRRTLRAILGTPPDPKIGNGELHYDVPGSTTDFNWTATFDLTVSPDPAADTTMALGAESRGMWLGRIPAAANEVTTYEFGQIPGPAAPCTAPLARTAVTSIPSFINASTANSPVTISGVADTANVASVSVALNGKSYGANPTANGTWSVTVPANDVAAVPEGSSTVTTSFTASPGGAGAPNDTRPIVKDTIAPPVPTATPAPGTYTGAQSVSLDDADTAATIHYTTASGPPGVAYTAGSPISVTASETIRATATDPAGNTSSVVSLAYTIEAPPAAPPTAGGTTTIIQIVPSPAAVAGGAAAPAAAAAAAAPAGPAGQAVAGATATSPARPAVSGLRVAVAKGHALRVSLRLGSGANVVRFRVFRLKNGHQSGRALVTLTRLATGHTLSRTLRGAALRRLRPGRYVLVAQAGANASALSAATRVAFSVR